jgi:hypothetical protein
MSSQPPVSTWKCNNCGTANRFGNPTCVLCNNPRPADVAMPSGGSHAPLGGTPTQFGGTPGATPGPPPSGAPPYGGQRPSSYSSPYGAPSPMAKADSMPVGLIILAVLEGLGVLSSLWGIVSSATTRTNPMPMPMGGGRGPMPFDPTALAGTVGIVANLIALAVAGFVLYGFIRRLNAARIVAMVQVGLNLLFSLIMGGIGLLVMAGGAAMKSSPVPAMPPAPGSPGGVSAPSGVTMIGGVLLAVCVVCLIISGVVLWYLTTESVKNWLSE